MERRSEGGRDNLLETSLIPEDAEEQRHKKLSLLVQVKKNRMIAAAQKAHLSTSCNQLAPTPSNCHLQQNLTSQGLVEIRYI